MPWPGRVPSQDRRVVAAGSQTRAVRRKGHTVNPAVMSFELADLLAGGDLPQVYSSVRLARGQRLAVGRKGDSMDPGLIPAALRTEPANFLPGCDRPQANCAIVTARGQGLA